ncbi:MAG: sugar phosphate nucleotidyltransferase, partial [Planctomycetota bacterium]|nr:sugar phosphate nucleotidyltransferase [Planctomycetota bacterium]
VEIDGSKGRAFHVKRFVEKPDAKTAEGYLAAGNFGWNSGMFVWRAADVLEAIRLYKPESHAGLMQIADAWGTTDQARALAEVYPALPKISVDFAIMEPASTGDDFDVCTVVTDVDWRDVGSWPSYGETLEADERGNRTAGGEAAPTTLVDCDGTLVVNGEKGHRVAALGLKDVIIVHTERATLVMPAAQAERLKELHATLPDELK